MKSVLFLHTFSIYIAPAIRHTIFDCAVILEFPRDILLKFYSHSHDQNILNIIIECRINLDSEQKDIQI